MQRPSSNTSRSFSPRSISPGRASRFLRYSARATARRRRDNHSRVPYPAAKPIPSRTIRNKIDLNHDAYRQFSWRAVSPANSAVHCGSPNDCEGGRHHDYPKADNRSAINLLPNILDHSRNEARTVKVTLLCFGDENACPIERGTNFTKGFYPRRVKVKEGGKVKIVLGRLTKLDCL
jgi:hypothetical protein